MRTRFKSLRVDANVKAGSTAMRLSVENGIAISENQPSGVRLDASCAFTEPGKLAAMSAVIAIKVARMVDLR